MRLIDADALKAAMYHEAFENDASYDEKNPLAKWDSGLWVRYKMFERCLDSATSIDAEPQWIPCSERLPEVRQWVLCCCRTGTMDVLRLTNDGSWNKNYPHVDYMSDFVVAWMPLPEPYERKES